MIMNIKTYDNKISELESDIVTTDAKATKNATDISTLSGRVTTNATNISGLNTRVTTNASNITTLTNNLSTLTTNFNAVSDLAYNHLCYTAVITIAEGGSYTFESPFLRAMLIGQINNFVHIVHICRDGVYAAAEGFRTENMTLMGVTGTANGITITNLNADNVLRVFVLFK